MIRTAKGVALHDLSFWAGVLPLLEGLPRVMKDYERAFGRPVPLPPGVEADQALHDATLVRLVEMYSPNDLSAVPEFSIEILVRTGPLDGLTSSERPNWHDSPPHDRMAANLISLLAPHATEESQPQIEVPIPGCGVVLGGSCDLVWSEELVEVKLTAALPSLRDVRQLLVYAGLLHLSGTDAPVHGMVANPRLGVAAEFDINELLSMSGGVDLDEFASRLADFLVDSQVSTAAQ